MFWMSDALNSFRRVSWLKIRSLQFCETGEREAGEGEREGGGIEREENKPVWKTKT